MKAGTGLDRRSFVKLGVGAFAVAMTELAGIVKVQ